jgi:hypothetical protein
MSRRSFALAVLFVSALAAAPAAAGDGPMPGAMQGGSGLLLSPGGPGGGTRLVAIGDASLSGTTLEEISTKDGTVLRTSDLAGAFGVPVITYGAGAGEGLSTDGKTIVLGDVAQTYPRTSTMFLVIDRKSLQQRQTIALKGDFAFDALSPHARWLYLIQHVDQNDMTKYVVRRYDLVAGRLLPGKVADRTQKGWVMRGYPMSRMTSMDGRWVYTLYQPGAQGAFPFIHALDTVRGVAHCIGLPWHGNMNGFYNLRLSLRSGGGTLAVHWLSGRPWLTVNTHTWRISADHGSAFPWAWIAGGLAGATGIAGVAAFLLRRRRREEFEQELVDLFDAAEREVMV